MRLEDCMPEDCMSLCAQMEKAAVLALLDAAAASTTEEQKEIGRLQAFVARLASNHDYFNDAPTNPDRAVGYWQDMRGASCALVAPE